MTLIDRVRDALAPALEVQRELGTGGAGAVFLARDVALDREVAVKVLRPEVATAVSVERFVREARLLARLRHPRVLPVYQAGSSGGILYFVMELARGESLADRLERGPLDRSEAIQAGLDLLDVLTTAHGLGIIHRDIKPANIFLQDGHALLADFGIAHTVSLAGGDSELTVAGEYLGTPAYMAPEQMARLPVTSSADLHAVGMVLYECLTGSRWPTMMEPVRGDWSRVPRRIAKLLRRALAIAPEERWADAAAMRAALDTARKSRWQVAIPAVAVLGAAVLVLSRNPAGGAGPPELYLGDFTATGTENQAYADSLRQSVIVGLAGLTDFSVREGSGSGPRFGTALTGNVSVSGEELRLQAALRHGIGDRRTMQWSVPRSSWREVVDSLASRAIDGMLRRESPWTPWQALPQLPAARDLLWRAERFYGDGAWSEARRAYAEAELLDSTCLLCGYRQVDVSRWLEEPVDPGLLDRLRTSGDRFPRHYRLLMAADDLPMPARLDSLRAVAMEYRSFNEAWYRYAEELFHRGPLYGHDRVEARDPFARAHALGSTPTSSLFDLAILLIAERERDSAAAVVGRLRASAHDPRYLEWAVLAQMAFGAAFHPDSGVPASVVSALRDPGIQALPEVAAGPRLLPLFDTPRGSLALGATYLKLGSGTPLARSGLIAHVFGHAALGQIDSMRKAGAALRAAFPGREGDWLAPQLEVLLAAMDDVPDRDALDEARRTLDHLLRADVRPASVRWASAWLLGVIAARVADQALVDSMLGLLRDEPAPRHRTALVRAWRDAAEGRRAAALGATAAILGDSVVVEGDAHGDLYLRAGVKLSRALWLAADGATDAARRELRWHQHFHRHADPIADPVGAEVDWAAGTLAEWQAAGLGSGPDHETCRALSTVVRNWSQGVARLAERAERAAIRLDDLGCPSRP